MTDLNLIIRDTDVTVCVTCFEPAIPWSPDEDSWPAHIEYELFDEYGEQLDWNLEPKEHERVLDAYLAIMLENREDYEQEKAAEMYYERD